MADEYILRKIDPDLWTRVKAKARADNVTIRAAIMHMLTLYAGGKISIRATRTK